MQTLTFLVVLVAALAAVIVALPYKFQEKAPAPFCNATACKLPNCRCSSTDIPGGLARNQTPQFVLLTFDDAVTISNIDFYRNAIYNRRNPNNCSISATYFVSHEYTDYSLVHELHANGNEIALHSLTHEVNTLYWKNASVDLLKREFADQKMTMQKFAKVPASDIGGLRVPFLQMAGNNQFRMMKDNNFLYDLSWTTQAFVNPGLWPYTTEYQSTQECIIGPCPDESFPNVWTIPMINWFDEENRACSMLDACVNISNETAKITEWMKREFLKQYNGNRAPVGLYLHAAWFYVAEQHFDAYLKFLDYLKTLPDVYMVSAKQLINWVKNPIPVSQMNSTTFKCAEKYSPACTPRACELMKEGQFQRWMTSCIANCPKSYPWLSNPLGEL